MSKPRLRPLLLGSAITMAAGLVTSWTITGTGGAAVTTTSSRPGAAMITSTSAGVGVTPGSASAAVARRLPAGFENTAARSQGQVVRVDYRTVYNGAGIDKHALVYLPAGYSDEGNDRRYDIVYLMHGAGGTAEGFLTGAGQQSVFKNVVDHMVEDQLIKPTIVVTPTFYPDGNSSMDLHYAGQLDKIFPRELTDDLMPTVERKYRTYARTVDPAGFKASRDHRAFSGFSMGAITTWYVFAANLDYFNYFMPMAGDSWAVQDYGGVSAPEQTAVQLGEVVSKSGYDRNDFLIAASVGVNDGTTGQMDPQIREMRKLPEAFDDGETGNLRYILDPDGGHTGESMRRQFYESIQLFF